MADSKSEAKKLIEEHGRAIDALHRRIAAMPGVDTAKLSMAVEKYKSAHATFEEDALECVVH